MSFNKGLVDEPFLTFHTAKVSNKIRYDSHWINLCIGQYSKLWYRYHIGSGKLYQDTKTFSWMSLILSVFYVNLLFSKIVRHLFFSKNVPFLFVFLHLFLFDLSCFILLFSFLPHCPVSLLLGVKRWDLGLHKWITSPTDVSSAEAWAGMRSQGAMSLCKKSSFHVTAAKIWTQMQFLWNLFTSLDALLLLLLLQINCDQQNYYYFE